MIMLPEISSSPTQEVDILIRKPKKNMSVE